MWSLLLDEIELTKHSLNLKTYSPNMLGVLKFELKGKKIKMQSSNTVSGIIDVDHEETVTGATGSVNNVSTLWSLLIGQRTRLLTSTLYPFLLAEDYLQLLKCL